MSLYDPPKYNSSGTYNEFDYSNNIFDASTIDTTVFVHKAGDSMVGSLNVPSLNLYDTNGSLEFSDLTEQTTAFSQVYIDQINTSSNTDHLNTIDITFADNSVQSTAFTSILKSKLTGNNTDLTNITSISVFDRCHDKLFYFFHTNKLYYNILQKYKLYLIRCIKRILNII